MRALRPAIPPPRGNRETPTVHQGAKAPQTDGHGSTSKAQVEKGKGPLGSRPSPRLVPSRPLGRLSPPHPTWLPPNPVENAGGKGAGAKSACLTIPNPARH